MGYAVPGVYYEPRPRALPRPLARTDVVGFVGFEPRVRDGTHPTQLIGAGHVFRVNVTGFQLQPAQLKGTRATVPSTPDFILSQAETGIPIAAGGSITYALVAKLRDDGKLELLTVAGAAAPTETPVAATDNDIIAAVGTDKTWVRIADVHVRRSTDGKQVFPTIFSALPPTRCDDWKDFELQLGGIPAIEDGTFLAHSVRAYFANGGSRCHVVTIRRPRFDDTEGMAAAIADLVGIAGASETEATGLEKLLRIFEVAVVDTPDLYARSVEPLAGTFILPPPDVAARFRCCDDSLSVRLGASATGTSAPAGPLFDDDAVLEAQEAMLWRCAPERWRVLLLLAAPVALELDDRSISRPRCRQHPRVAQQARRDQPRRSRRVVRGLLSPLGANAGKARFPDRGTATHRARGRDHRPPRHRTWPACRTRQ